MIELLLSLMIWISVITGFTVPEIPHIKKVTLSELRYITFGCDHIQEINKAVCTTKNPDELTLALYMPEKETILLYNGWDKDKKADQSILLHELVHHMQYANDYDKDMAFCGSPALEAQAYELQTKWLEKYGMTLQKDLGIGPLFVHLLTQCHW